MSVIQVDPRVQALFDQNLAQTRRRGEEITGNLRAEQQRIAAQLRENTEKFARQREEIKGQLAQLDQQKEQPKRASNPWAKPAQGDGNELSFATEDDDPGSVSYTHRPTRTAAAKAGATASAADRGRRRGHVRAELAELAVLLPVGPLPTLVRGVGSYGDGSPRPRCARRYSPGDMPVARRKARLKSAGRAKPQRAAIAAMDRWCRLGSARSR